MDMDVHGLRCQIVPSDRGGLEWDIFADDAILTSPRTFQTVEAARADLDARARAVAQRRRAAPRELARIRRLAAAAGYPVRDLPGTLHAEIARPDGTAAITFWFDPLSGWRTHDPEMQETLRAMARGETPG